jgi:hypothetical protein
MAAGLPLTESEFSILPPHFRPWYSFQKNEKERLGGYSAMSYQFFWILQENTTASFGINCVSQWVPSIQSTKETSSLPIQTMTIWVYQEIENRSVQTPRWGVPVSTKYGILASIEATWKTI